MRLHVIHVKLKLIFYVNTVDHLIFVWSFFEKTPIIIILIIYDFAKKGFLIYACMLQSQTFFDFHICDAINLQKNRKTSKHKNIASNTRFSVLNNLLTV